MKSLKELCLSSGSGKGFSAERLQQLEQTLIEDHRTDMPWYLRGIIAIGAWLASWFILAFVVTLIGWQEDKQSAIGVVGVVILVLAVVVGRQPWGVFAGQCALAVSLAAQIMIYFGFVNEHNHPLATAVGIAVGLAAILYIAFPSFLSRLMTCLGSLQLTLFWIYTGDSGDPFSEVRVQSDLSQLVLVYWALHLGAICWCFMKPRNAVVLAPLGYAFILSLTAWQVENLFNVWVRSSVIAYSPMWLEWLFFHLRTGLTALALFGVSVWAAGGLSVLRERFPQFLGLALVLGYLVAISTGGVLLALFLLLLGFSLQQRALLWLGLILLPVFLSHYYYSLSLNLLAKSGVLIGSGMVLLLLRTGIARWVFEDNKEAA